VQLQLKTILNEVHPIKGFVYEDVRLVYGGGTPWIEATVRERRGSKLLCGKCGEPGTCYDHQPERRFGFVPLWGLAVTLLFRPRRVKCERCGIHVETIPWAHGKYAMTIALMCFLATWARRLSWQEVARAFGTTWDSVSAAVTYVVEYGLAHRDLSDITAIGVDEIQYRKGHKYLTLVYQIDAHCRRLIWIGEDRKQRTMKAFFGWFGKRRSATLRFVCSDMWRPYINMIRRFAGGAVHVLDRFHVAMNLNKAVDQTRRREAAEIRKAGDKVTLKHTRWCLLKRPGKLTKPQRGRLRSLLKLNLRVVRAYLLKEDFDHFWEFSSVSFAARFLDRWCDQATASRIEPMQRMAGTLQKHRELLLNYFRAKKEYSSAIVEGLNNKLRVVTRRSYGFRKLDTLKIALFHTLGCLPEPELAHRFA
jgi:transposase